MYSSSDSRRHTSWTRNGKQVSTEQVACFHVVVGLWNSHSSVHRQNLRRFWDIWNNFDGPDLDCPQLLLSFLYLSYNSLFTSMLLAQEWNGYATCRKALRVTSPKGQQRSTYYLQLPYRYSVPLLLASAALHWLVSQSLFLARVIVLDRHGIEDPSQSIATCGFSNIALLFVICLGSLLVLIVLGHGFRRFESMMPLARSCSATISAACHPPELDTDAASKPVKWGVVEGYEVEKVKAAIPHCTFTSFEVSRPIEGELYQ